MSSDEVERTLPWSEDELIYWNGFWFPYSSARDGKTWVVDMVHLPGGIAMYWENFKEKFKGAVYPQRVRPKRIGR